MSKAKSKTEAAGVLLGDGTIRLKQPDAKGKLVEREFTLTPYPDLPRKVRRQLRNAMMKAMPDTDSVTGKQDLYLASYEAGLIALRAAGAVIDPDDDTLPDAEGDALDSAIMLVGLRVLSEMNQGAGDPKNAEEDPATDAVPENA